MPDPDPSFMMVICTMGLYMEDYTTGLQQAIPALQAGFYPATGNG
jgi:hypothetical protein